MKVYNSSQYKKGVFFLQKRHISTTAFMKTLDHEIYKYNVIHIYYMSQKLTFL